MLDIYLSLAIMALLSTALFFGGARLARRHSNAANAAWALCVVLAVLLYTRYVWYDIALVRWLPFSGLIVLGNWYPLGAGLLGGIAWGHLSVHWIRRSVAVGALAATGGYAVFAPLVGDPPECGEQWAEGGVCQQTTKYTCTPTCAATLLHMHGIAATEKEMAELCFTRKGTTWQGLYRGLKLKTADTKWDVEIIACSVEELQHRGAEPMILMVGLEDDQESDIRYQTEDGWIPGVGHSVILLGSGDQNAFEIIDPAPSAGRETWTDRDLNTLWRNYGIRLVCR